MKGDYLQIRVDKGFKLLLSSYCKQKKIKMTDFCFDVFYFYFQINDMLDFYKYREELNHLNSSNADSDYLTSYADKCVKKLL